MSSKLLFSGPTDFSMFSPTALVNTTEVVSKVNTSKYYSKLFHPFTTKTYSLKVKITMRTDLVVLFEEDIFFLKLSSFKLTYVGTVMRVLFLYFRESD